MILKIMSKMNMNDDDPRKACAIIDDVEGVAMSHSTPEETWLFIKMRGREDIDKRQLFQNAYVMNDAGRTIQTLSGRVVAHDEFEHL